MKACVLGCVITAVALSGCVSTKATMLGGAQALQTVSADQVAIYRTPSPVPGPYLEVALLTSAGDSVWTDERAMFKSMQKRAAAVGADAVILENVREVGMATQVAAAIFGMTTTRRGQSVGIRLLTEEEAAKRPDAIFPRQLAQAPVPRTAALQAAMPPSAPPRAATPVALPTTAAAAPAAPPKQCGMVPQPNGSVRFVPC